MAKATQVKINVKGIDQASAVFRKIGKTAKQVAVGIAAISAAGAAAAAGVMKTWQAMTKIGDLAQKGGLGAGELQKMAGAMGQLGIQGASVEQLSQAFAVMQKTTGQSGIEGFFKVLDEAKSGGGIKSLTDAFGKAGLNFAPLLAGDTDALKQLVEMQYAMADSSVVAAERASNAWSLACEGFKAAWFDFAGELAKDLDENVEGGVYAAAFKSVAYVTAAVKSVKSVFTGLWNVVKTVCAALQAPFEMIALSLMTWYNQAATAISGLFEAIKTRSLEPLKQAWKDIRFIADEGRSNMANLDAFKRLNDAIDGVNSSIANIKGNFTEAAKAAAEAPERAARFADAKAKAAGTFTGANFGKTSSAASVGQARNDLILGGSHAATLALNRRNSDTNKIRIATEEMVDVAKDIRDKLDLEVA